MDLVSLSLLLGILSWFTLKLIRIGHRDVSLPPGPSTVPILGNIHLLPVKFAFLKLFSEWAKEYGGIYSLKVANGTLIVVSDVDMVKELFDDRSAETASRPSLYAADYITEKNYLGMATADNHVWKMGRKAIAPLMAPQVVQSHLPIAEAETTRLLHDILHDNEEVCSHITRSTLSFVTSVVFGNPIPSHDSPEATLFHEYIGQWSKSLSPDAAPVDLVPLLKYVPESWAPWKKLWRETRRLQRSLYFSLLEQAERRVLSGLRNESYIENILDRQPELGLTRDMVAYIGGVLLDGGAETSASFLQSLVLCLSKSPTILRKAQKEIDTVVGKDRLPVSDDFQYLPYVQAIIKEMHRFRPAAPTGIPHAAVNDIQYRGYTIPKGAPIFMNIWGIFHDPDLFERPDEFWPDRYILTADGTKPGISKTHNIRATFVFGSGKRLCPGMNLVNTNLALAVMRLIWAFNFTHPECGLGSQTPTWNIEREYNDGMAFSPKPFKCKITPRSQERIEVIEDDHKKHVDYFRV